MPNTPYYGWRIVAALFIMLAFSSGFGFYNQSVLLEALTRENDFDVSAVSFATTMFFGVSGLTGLLVAYLLERFDVRVSLTLGVLIAATGLTLVGQVDKLWQIYAIFALFGIGFAGINMVTGTTLVTRWFHTRRPLALAIAATGLSVGGIALTPIAARIIKTYGLEGGTPILAGFLLLGILPISLLLLRDSPASLGLLPHGAEPASGASAAQPKAFALFVPYRAAIRSRFFLWLTAAYVCGLGAQVGGIAHQFKLISDQTTLETASLGVSVLAGSSVIGRLIAGMLLRWLKTHGFAIALSLAQATALFSLGQAQGRTALLLASSAFGLTVGSYLLMRPLLVAEAFGVRHYPRIYSIGNVLTSFGVALGPFLVGRIHDSSGGYPMAFTVISGISVFAALLLWLAGPIQEPARTFGETAPASLPNNPA